jgi:hypothetical protein
MDALIGRHRYAHSFIKVHAHLPGRVLARTVPCKDGTGHFPYILPHMSDIDDLPGNIGALISDSS